MNGNGKAFKTKLAESILNGCYSRSLYGRHFRVGVADLESRHPQN